ELVIADCRGGIAEGVVALHDRLALEDVRFERALKQIAAVDEDDAPAVRGAQRIDVTLQNGQAAPVIDAAVLQRVVVAGEPAVDIGRADEDDVHRTGGRGAARRGRGDGGGGAGEGEEENGREQA